MILSIIAQPYLEFLAELTLPFTQLEEYDKMVRELGFEMKAQPSEKLKTPEELAREDREKLQKLEVRSQNDVLNMHTLSEMSFDI